MMYTESILMKRILNFYKKTKKFEIPIQKGKNKIDGPLLKPHAILRKFQGQIKSNVHDWVNRVMSNNLLGKKGDYI